MLIRAEDFDRLGGFSPAIFMYFDDADLGWRARIAGRCVLFCPEAVVEHDYEFDKGPRKWTWLEESRLAAVFEQLRGRTLLLLSPFLLVTELAIIADALRGGWAAAEAAGLRLGVAATIDDQESPSGDPALPDGLRPRADAGVHRRGRLAGAGLRRASPRRATAAALRPPAAGAPALTP